ncbi:DUF938 domain-containing protein [Sphingorhabdus sp. Alg239-R122]|uniref:DUF938 domain-containing protein n=1 Tax=Sphingorhabdus sp. Alg239-R122 TaxID=2305989 RepID=UPI0013DA5A14|nr:DUF938 domain-containing protein [Sphingorhabdus sp. Alg239-R122]
MADSYAWDSESAGPEAKKHAPATLRNRDAIAAVLRTVLPNDGLVLEIASGSGEHAVHFARAFAHLRFQPSDASAEACRSIAAWVEEANVANILPPVQLDVMQHDWPVAKTNAILCINMVHISPWPASEALFRGSAAILEKGAPLFLYGPYISSEIITAPSNRAFDQSLKVRNPDWGLRDIADVDRLAARYGFVREAKMTMPANNFSLIYRKTKRALG